MIERASHIGSSAVGLVEQFGIRRVSRDLGTSRLLICGHWLPLGCLAGSVGRALLNRPGASRIQIKLLQLLFAFLNLDVRLLLLLHRCSLLAESRLLLLRQLLLLADGTTCQNLRLALAVSDLNDRHDRLLLEFLFFLRLHHGLPILHVRLLVLLV